MFKLLEITTWSIWFLITTRKRPAREDVNIFNISLPWSKCQITTLQNISWKWVGKRTGTSVQASRSLALLPFLLLGFSQTKRVWNKASNHRGAKQHKLEKAAHCYIYACKQWANTIDLQISKPKRTWTWWTLAENIILISNRIFGIIHQTFNSNRSITNILYILAVLNKGLIQIQGSNDYNFRMNAFWGEITGILLVSLLRNPLKLCISRPTLIKYKNIFIISFARPPLGLI